VFDDSVALQKWRGPIKVERDGEKAFELGRREMALHFRRKLIGESDTDHCKGSLGLQEKTGEN